MRSCTSSCNHAKHHHSSSSKFNDAFSALRRISFLWTASNELSPIKIEQVKLWLITEMKTIPLFSKPYDSFRGKFQSPHFVLFRNVRVRRSYQTVQMYFIKSSGNRVTWYFIVKVSISSFRDNGCCRKLILFLFITNPSVSFAVDFLSLPGYFLASHHLFSWLFLKILWITLLDSPTVFEKLDSQFSKFE